MSVCVCLCVCVYVKRPTIYQKRPSYVKRDILSIKRDLQLRKNVIARILVTDGFAFEPTNRFKCGVQVFLQLRLLSQRRLKLGLHRLDDLHLSVELT